MSHAAPFISLTGVSIRLHGDALFDRLDWEIESDQHWAVVGPNGSGKSALMRAIAGSLPLAQGKISYGFPSEKIAYVSFDRQKTLLPREAFLQERWNAAFSEGPTVAEMLPAKDAHAKKIIGHMELKPLLKRKSIELSNGERRKLEIAHALLTNPKLLILDNPFEGLDARFRAKLQKLLTALMRTNLRILIVAASEDEIPEGITNVLHVKEQGIVSQVKNAARKKSPQTRIRTSQSKAKRGEILVQMKKVNVVYGGVHILKNINWTVREGEKWALFGPNGAGKTTLLSLILGDNPQAYANDITLFGKRRGTGESIWEIKRNIGWVSPELQLYYPAEATCFDVVASGWFDTIGLYRQCTPHQQKVARAWLQRLGLAKEAETPFENVSEGEERLVLLARALVKSPRLLVLDEPVAGLDAANRDRVLKAVDAVAKHPNMSMIYVTHRADEIPKSITHTLQLKKPA